MLAQKSAREVEGLPKPSCGGDCVVTDSPEAASEQSDIEKLADAIRRHPGQITKAVIDSSGVPVRRGRVLLERYEGQHWISKSGSRNARLYFPAGDEPADL